MMQKEKKIIYNLKFEQSRGLFSTGWEKMTPRMLPKVGAGREKMTPRMFPKVGASAGVGVKTQNGIKLSVMAKANVQGTAFYVFSPGN